MSAMKLHALLDGELATQPPFDPDVTGLTADSNAVQPGDVFVALRGATTHGLRFAMQADAAGAAAIVFDPPAPDALTLPATTVAVEGLRNKLGRIASRFHGHPSHALAITGVTGTNGKTSTVQLIAQALTLRGAVAGTIGTLGAGLHGALVPGERTTPDVISVHRTLAQLRDAGASHVAMEVSSHALEQGRVDAVAFKVAVFTNLTRDHLDFHGTMEAYGAAKAKLFAWPGLEAAVVNLDDAFGAALMQRLPPGIKRFGLSSRDHAAANLRAGGAMLTPAGLVFGLVEGGLVQPVESPLLGRFNIDNLLAVAGALRALGWTLPEIGAVLSQLKPVDGRMSRVGGNEHQPLVVVDYAHTPDALEQALSSVREHTPGRLTCVFGCGGDRDRGKRPQMAAIAERLADRVIVTDDNPRNEDGDAIVAEICAGFADADAVAVERNRVAAITQALAEARPGDVVLVAGKGHEAYQEIAGVKHPLDDLAIARELLEMRR